MDQFTFAMLSMFGAPFALIGLVLLAHRLTPKSIWFSTPVQIVATAAVLGAIAVPVAIAQIDSQGDYFDGEAALVSEAFALPAGVKVSRQRDRTLRLGDCWRNAVNWRSEVEFASPQAFDRWYAAQGYREPLVDQIAGYFGVPPENISIADGALDLRDRDPGYQLSDANGSYVRNTRILEFYEPFVCAAIDRDASGNLSLRRCDPLAAKADIGSEGWVIINPSAKERRLEGRIYYAQGPAHCTNPLRRAANKALGLPHPEGGKPNTNVGGNMPIW